MKLLTKKNIVIGMAAIFIAGGSFVWAQNLNKKDFTEETNKQGGAEQTVDKDGTKLKEDGTKIDSTVPTQDSSVTVTMSSANFDSGRGVALVRAFVVGASSGTCTVLFTKGNDVVERSAGVVFSGSLYACQGFDVPKSDFPTQGQWQVKVRFNNQGSVVESNSGSIDVN